MNRASMENVRDKWIPEVLRYCGRGVPILLVGTKLDLREDPEMIETLKAKKQTPVQTEEGKQLCIEFKLVEYLECSALTQVGLRHVFIQAMRHAIEKQSAPKKETCILQ